MYCQKCGKQNEDDAVICNQCGVSFSNTKANKQNPILEKPQLLYAVIALLIGLLFVGCYSYFRYQEISIKKQEQDHKEVEQLLVKNQEEHQERMRNICLLDAEKTYWDFVKLNGKIVPGQEGTYRMPQYQWDMADKKKKDASELCLKQYPVK